MVSALNLPNERVVMKKLIAAAIIALPVASMAIDTPTGSAEISGTIGVRTSIQVGETPAAGALDLVNGVSNEPVAITEEINNVKFGYTVSLTSENGFKLVHDDVDTGDDSRVPYSISYTTNDASTTLAAGTTSEITVVSPGAGPLAVNHDTLVANGSTVISDFGFQTVGTTRVGTLAISTDPQVEEDLLAGVHADVLTFSIAAKEAPSEE